MIHIVNLLNAIDGGKRRCITVTNSEVSEKEEKKLAVREKVLAALTNIELDHIFSTEGE